MQRINEMYRILATFYNLSIRFVTINDGKIHLFERIPNEVTSQLLSIF